VYFYVWYMCDCNGIVRYL